MSFLRVAPGAVASAAGNLESIGSALNAAHAAAASGTTGMAAMATDEVSAAVQSAFVTYAQGYQTVSAQAAAVHAGMVRLFNSNALAYAGTEMASVEQTLAVDVSTAEHTMSAEVLSAEAAVKYDFATEEQYIEAWMKENIQDLIKISRT